MAKPASPKRPDYAVASSYGYIVSSTVKVTEAPERSVALRDFVAGPSFRSARLSHMTHRARHHPPASWDVMQRRYRRSN